MSFTVYPALDIRDGRVVRLLQGDYARETRYGDDVLPRAQAFADAGAQWMHLVDLDAAKAVAGRTTRVNLANLQTLQNRKSAIERFMQAYRENVEWMYSDPAALKTYGDFSGLPDTIVQRVREFIPKETMAPDRIVGMDQVVADAIKLKFINEPLTAEQVKEFIQIPESLK